MPSRTRLLLVAQADYEHWECLTQVPSVARELAKTLSAGGYDLSLEKLLDGGTKVEVEQSLNEWLRDEVAEKDRLLVYWIGHGATNGSHYLVARDSPRGGLTALNAVPTRELGSVLATSRAEKVLVVADTCYSSAAAPDMVEEINRALAGRTSHPGQQRYMAFVPSVHAWQKAEEGAFCRMLLKVLTGSDPSLRLWSDFDEHISVDGLMTALFTALGHELGDHWQLPRPFTVGFGDRFLPNPRYRTARPALDVEPPQPLLKGAVTIGPSDGAIEAGEAVRTFTGRWQARRALVAWLMSNDPSLMVVTGPPGSGKSAVINHVVTLSDPRFRSEAQSAGLLEADAPELAFPWKRMVDVVVDARGRTRAECAQLIAEHVGISLFDEPVFQPARLMQLVRRLAAPVTVVVDGLDEAADPLRVGALLSELARGGRALVLVGTRPDLGAQGARRELLGRDRHAALRDLFGEDVGILDLEAEPNTSEDIAHYVSLCLRDSASIQDETAIARVAGEVAEKAQGSFLYARFVSRTFQDAQRLDVSIPSTVEEAFVRDLQVGFGEHGRLVDDVLAALAWGQGAGLSRRVWAPVATALCSTRTVYHNRDIAWVLGHAGRHILEGGEAGLGVYRLAHQRLAEYYQGRRRDAADAHRRIVAALAEGVAGAAWLNADLYLWRHLADHAASGHVLDQLVMDVGFLAVADPRRLLPILARGFADPSAQTVAALYQQVGDQLHHADPVERMAMLHLTAHQEAPSLASELAPVLPPRWQCRWAHWRATTPHRILQGHDGPVNAVVMGVLDGASVIVSGGSDGTIQVWEADTGYLRSEPLTAHWGKSVNAVAWGEVRGQPVIVSGGGDGTVEVWEARTGRRWSRPLSTQGTAVSSVAMGIVAGEAVIVCGADNGTVRTWDARTGRLIWKAHAGRGARVARVCSVAFGEVDRQSVIVAGDEDSKLWAWDARTGHRRDEPLFTHGGVVSSVVVGNLGDKPAFVCGGGDGTVRIYDARTRTLWGRPFIGHDGPVMAVALGSVDGDPVIVSAGADWAICIWEAQTWEQLGQPFTAYGGCVNSVALGEVDQHPVVVSGGDDGMVRVWDARTAPRPGELPRGHTGKKVNAVAVGSADGDPIVVSGGEDAAIRIWDARTGSDAESISSVGGAVHCVALGILNGHPVIVSGQQDGTVRVWQRFARYPRTFSPSRLVDPSLRVPAPVNALALGEVDGQLVIVAAGRDGVVRVWYAPTERRSWRRPPTREQLLVHGRSTVTSLATGEVGGNPVIVSGGKDGIIRVWDVRTGQCRKNPLTGHKGWVNSVAMGAVDGDPFIVSGGEDGTVRVWDVRTNRPRGEPLRGHKRGVNTVVAGELDGDPVIVSGGNDGKLYLWDARTLALSLQVSLGSPISQVALTSTGGVALSMTRGLMYMDLFPA